MNSPFTCFANCFYEMYWQNSYDSRVLMTAFMTYTGKILMVIFIGFLRAITTQSRERRFRLSAFTFAQWRS